MNLRSFAAAVVLAACSTAAPAQSIQAVTEFSPYTYLRDGLVPGPATEVVQATLREAGLADHRIAPYPWARAYDMALRDPNVLIYLIARTPARERLFKWAGRFMTMEYHLYRLKERADITVASLDDARRYTIGVMRDDVRHQYLRDKGFVRLVVAGDGLDNFRRLLNGQVQLIPLAEIDAAVLCKEAGVECNLIERVHTLGELSTDLYMAYSVATADTVVQRTGDAFERLRANGTLQRLMAQPAAARP